MERRRAAILAADVVGYSRLTERDDEASTAMLRVYRAVVEELISAHKGHIFTFFCRNCGQEHHPVVLVEEVGNRRILQSDIDERRL